MKKGIKKNGYSLIEALVAISVLLIAIVAPMTIAVQGIKTSNYALEQNTAFFLAQEGIEAMFALRSDTGVAALYGVGSSWDWIDSELNGNGPCSLSSPADICSFGIGFMNGDVAFSHTSNQCDAGNEDRCLLYYDEGDTPSVYSHVSTGGTPSQFTRIVTVQYEDNYVVKVISEVVWNSSVFTGVEQSVLLETNLFDFVNI